MNKLLTTIALLCFSVAANADIYFCESNVERFITSGGSFGTPTPYAPMNEKEVFIVDTENGMRWRNIYRDYRGNCSERLIGETQGVECVYINIITDSEWRIFVNTNHYPKPEFTAADHNVGSSIWVWAGDCTKA